MNDANRDLMRRLIEQLDRWDEWIDRPGDDYTRWVEGQPGKLVTETRELITEARKALGEEPLKRVGD